MPAGPQESHVSKQNPPLIRVLIADDDPAMARSIPNFGQQGLLRIHNPNA